MNNLRPNPVGIDKPIDRVQKRLYKHLSGLGLINGYARVYENNKDGKNVLEVYNGKNEYLNVFGQEDSKFFFVAEKRKTYSDAPNVRVDIVFMLNLNDFYPNEELLRKDEEIKEEVMKVLYRKPFKPTTEISGTDFLNTMLQGYIEGRNIKDMHPYHVFAVQGTMTFNHKNCS